MSGGVDSSLAAFLLAREGCEVVGVTMVMRPDGSACPSAAVEDASRVAREIGIPHHVVDFGRVFEEAVVAHFCAEYAAGRTPNPCVACNLHVKFGALLRWAREAGADRLATGHYARLDLDARTGRRLLRRAADRDKDQTYVLYGLPQDALASAVFPLGEMAKSEVRALARRLDLAVADRPESQEICFVDDDYRSFLEGRVPGIFAPGDIVDREGNVLGRHRGLSRHTVGQRRGLGLAGPRPLYVVALDRAANRVVVGPWEETFGGGLVATDLNFIPFETPPPGPLAVMAKVRYRSEPAAATLYPADEVGRARLAFARPERAITPGQAVVFYDGDLVLGGGTIAEALPV
jgi:tRNA-specific 2-thiouridylase